MSAFTAYSQLNTPSDLVNATTDTGGCVVTNRPPTLTASVTCASYTDTPNDDSFLPVAGQLSSTDPDEDDSPTFGLVGGATSTSRLGFDIAKTGTYGTLYLNSATGAYQFVPSDAAIEGLQGVTRENFTLTVTDESGARDTQSFTVNLEGTNDRPASAEDTYTVTEGSALQVAAAKGLLANDSDRDRDALSVVLVSNPSHGTLELNADGSFTYVPNAGFSGNDSFVYQASDSFQNSLPTRVTINVEPDPTPINRPPVAADDRISVVEDATRLNARTVTGNVLSNDRDPDEGDALRIVALNGKALGSQLILQGRYGTLTLRENGTYAYAFQNTDALISGETGTERFTYTIADEQGQTDQATLTLTIKGADLRITTSGSFTAHRGNDAITGQATADRVAGRTGNDTLRGEAGDDILWGEDGNDTLFGGLDNDRAVGGTGNDTLRLGDGDDRAWGEDGRDIIYGEAGDDVADGGAGDDQLILGSGDDRAWGGLGHDRLLGQDGNDSLTAGAGNDVLRGDRGNDELWGEDGVDRLYGGVGNDQFDGGAGNDWLFFDGGSDTGWGGAGNDRFIFSPGFGQSRIKDFQPGDKIVLSGIFTSFSQLADHMEQVGDDVVIDAPGKDNDITVENVDSLRGRDFEF